MNENLDSISTFDAGLDEAQLAAVRAVDGPVRITAVAGAGKTRTITRRIADACKAGLWEPNRTLAVTFSVKAANEMRLRLARLGVSQVTTATFHAAALSQLRRVWSMVSDAPFPALISDTRQVVRAAAEKIDGIDVPTSLEIRLLTDEINWAKVGLVAPSDYARACEVSGRIPPMGLEPGRMAQVLEIYERAKAARNSIDFNDILMLLSHVIEEDAAVADMVRATMGWLTVDEYQDVSPLQHHLMKLWLGTNRNICVVGDPAQTIYSFAGATSYYLLDFAREFGPLAADIDLQRDYRSASGIVDYANDVLRDSDDADDYLELVPAGDGLPDGGALGNDSTLPRQKKAVQTKSARTKTAQAKSAQRRRGSTVHLAHLETDDDEAHEIAKCVKTLVKQGVKPNEIAILSRTNAQLAPICSQLTDRSIPYALRKVDTQGVDLSSSSRSRDKEKSLSPPVAVSTIHAAKGLEWDYVFICGLSEGLLPYNSPQSGEPLEEERRLMYVGVTRARKELYLSYALRKDESSSARRVPSRFLQR